MESHGCVGSGAGDERFSRTALFLGKDAVAHLARCHVAVFGLGGVGGYAVEALARAGIGAITLVDNDCFCCSNINRQLHALPETVGQLKVAVAAQRCRAINPTLRVYEVARRYSAQEAADFFPAHYHYVLDCIDTVSAKIDLIQQCRARKLAVISAMGAANKIDPSLVRVGELFHSEKCRLARIMRKELRRRGIDSGVTAVYSTEQFHPPGGSERTPLLGSVATIPALFGLMMAGHVLQSLLTGVINDGN